MINNILFEKAISDSRKSVEQISDESGVPVVRINEFRENPNAEAKASEIQSLSIAMNMSENLRRNVWYLRDLPLD